MTPRRDSGCADFRDYESLIDSVGTPGFGDAILTAAAKLANVSEVFAFVRGDGKAPVPIISSGAEHAGRSETRAKLYASRFHRLDPVMQALAGTPDTRGQMLMRRVAADEIGDAAYRHECFEKPLFGGKWSFAYRRGLHHYVLSFYWRGRAEAGAGMMASLAEMTLPAIRKHAELTGLASGESLAEKVAWRLQHHYPALTERERTVCAHSLIGMTAEAIAIELAIKPSSVLTYRRRAYERLGISSVNQLLARLIL